MVGTGLGRRILRVCVGWDVLVWVRLVAPAGVESSPCFWVDMVGGGWV